MQTGSVNTMPEEIMSGGMQSVAEFNCHWSGGDGKSEGGCYDNVM